MDRVTDEHEVGETRWVLERVRQVDVEKAAAIGTELHDGGHKSRRATGDGLSDAVQRVMDRYRPRQGLYRPLTDDQDPYQERYGQEDVEHTAGDIDREVPDGGGVVPSKTAYHGDGHGDADGRAYELLHREHADLGEVRHRRFPGVVLPVGVG